MGDTPNADGRERSDEAAKLELPPLRLPRLGRRRKPERSATPADPTPADPTPAAEHPVAEAPRADVDADQPLMAPPTPVTPVVTTHQVDGHDNGTRPLGAVATEVEDQEHTTEEPGRSFTLPARPSLPRLSTRTAVWVTGAVVGVVGALLTFLALRGCDVVAGTESCGGGPGLLLLVVILAVMVALGSALLSLWGVDESRGTSVLAVGVLCVVLLLTLIQDLFSSWMFLALPVLGAPSYLLAHWVTTTFVEATPEDGPQHDVR